MNKCLKKTKPLFKKSNNSNVYYHNYMKIKNESDDDLSLEKTLNIQNTINVY